MFDQKPVSWKFLMMFCSVSLFRLLFFVSTHVRINKNRSRIIDSWKCIYHYQISKPVWCKMKPIWKIFQSLYVHTNNCRHLMMPFRHRLTCERKKNHFLFKYMICIFSLIYFFLLKRNVLSSKHPTQTRK